MNFFAVLFIVNNHKLPDIVVQVVQFPIDIVLNFCFPIFIVFINELIDVRTSAFMYILAIICLSFGVFLGSIRGYHIDFLVSFVGLHIASEGRSGSRRS